MNFFKGLFSKKQAVNNHTEQNLILQEILKSSPTEALSFLNRKVELTQALHLPVAESMLLIEKMHQLLLSVDQDYAKEPLTSVQWDSLYQYCSAYMLVQSLNDTVLEQRYRKLSFEPLVKEVLYPNTTKPVVIGPRKISKVRYLEFSKTIIKVVKNIKYSNVPPHRLLEHFALQCDKS